MENTIKIAYSKLADVKDKKDMSMSMDGIEDMRNIHSLSMSNSTQCRPNPTFDHMEMISAYAGLFIMFVMVIYSRYVNHFENKDRFILKHTQKHEREKDREREIEI